MRLSLLIICCIIMIAMVSIGSAISTNLRDNYAPKETIIIEISGQVLEPISFEKVRIIRNGHINVPVEYDIKKVGDKYFLWALAPENINNYTLEIQDIATEINGAQTRYIYAQNFSVSGNYGDYSISPGFIIAQEDFGISVELFENSPKIISATFPLTRDITLAPGKNNLVFTIERIQKTSFFTMRVGKYNVPVYIITNKTNGVQFEPSSLYFDPLQISYVLNETSSLQTATVHLINSGKKEIRDISLQFDTTLFEVKPKTIKALKANQTTFVNITLKKRLENTENFEIVAQSANESALLVTNIQIQKIIDVNRTLPSVNATSNTSKLYCPQLNGVICSGGTLCKDKEVPSKEGLCCLTKCEQKKQQSKAWIIVLLIGIILLIGTFVWVRYKKSGRPPANIIKEKIRQKQKELP